MGAIVSAAPTISPPRVKPEPQALQLGILGARKDVWAAAEPANVAGSVKIKGGLAEGRAWIEASRAAAT